MFGKWIITVLSAFLAVSPLLADERNGQTASQQEAPAAAAKPAPQAAEKPAAPDIAAQIEQLRLMVLEQARQMEAQQKLMQAQQEKLNALTEELRAARAAASAAPAPAPQAPALDARVAKVEADVAANKKSSEDGIKSLGPLKFFGDIRLRDEPFFGGPVDLSQDRNRMRYRVRFGANAKLNNEFSGGFAFATGDVNDPITSNQTVNQFYTRKAFALDKAFLTYTPHYFKPLTLTGGKFAYPWYRTELTWDNDLNPEGLAQTLSWDVSKVPGLKKIALVGFELPLAEVAGTSLQNKSIVQSAVYGGQLQTTWQLGDRVKLSAYTGFYNYHHADPIALAAETALTKNPQTPMVGTLALANLSNMQNSITVITKTAVVQEATGVVPTGVTSITSAQFASKFALFDSIARLDVKTPYERWPLVFLGDFVQNTRACANVPNLPIAAPANSTVTLPGPVIETTATFALSTPNGPCHSRERRGYWLEARAGRTQERGDWQLSYTRMLIEREAVMAIFNFSDIRQGSNVGQHRLEAMYQLHKNVQLAFTALIGRPLNWDKASAVAPEPMLKRLQFDVSYKF